MNAIERINYLFDKSSLIFENKITPSGYLLGKGQINKKQCYFVAVNKNEKPINLYEDIKNMVCFLKNCLSNPLPLIFLMDLPSHQKSNDKSIVPEEPEKVLADKFGVGAWYKMHSIISGKMPQIAIVFDRLGASLTFPALLTDICIMTKQAGMSIGRLDVVKNILRENVDYEKLGGANMHFVESGSVDFLADSEEKALDTAKKYLEYLRSEVKPYTYSKNTNIKNLIPANPALPMDIDLIIEKITDDNSFFEIKEGFAKEIITGFATFEGNNCGIIANRSKVKGGLFFPDSCEKTIKFINLCNSFEIPLIFLSDSAGFMVGSEVERQGIIKKGAELFSKICTSKTKIYSAVIRRAYTAGLYAMAGGGIKHHRFVALPSAIISIYGEMVTRLLDINDDELKNAEKMLQASKNPEYFLKIGAIDEIVDYSDLRTDIVKFLQNSEN